MGNREETLRDLNVLRSRIKAMSLLTVVVALLSISLVTGALNTESELGGVTRTAMALLGFPLSLATLLMVVGLAVQRSLCVPELRAHLTQFDTSSGSPETAGGP